MLRLDKEERPDIPPLAWGITWRRKDTTIHCYMGRWVESADNCIFSGAWSGRFQDLAFDSATTFCGTGLKVLDDSVLICSATDTLAPLYFSRTRHVLCASNSMALLLSLSRSELDLRYPFYDSDLSTVIFGLKGYRRTIPTRGMEPLHLRYFCNLTIDRDFVVKEHGKTSPPPFGNYEIYVDYLRNQICDLVENATSTARTLRFGQVASISTGYDSPASAVLAKDAGCRAAITFDKARDDFAYASDSGKVIGEKLGFGVIEFDSNSYKCQNKAYPEAEFFASGFSGYEVVFGPSETVLAGNLLFTGHFGGVWERYYRHVSRNVLRTDPAGNSLLEFALRVGCVVVAVPFIGCLNHSDIHRISNSSEMSRWSIADSDYDKPIARRIVESAGVPRELFGQRKLAVARPYQTFFWKHKKPLDDIMTKASYDDFMRFLDRHRITIRPRSYIWKEAVWRGLDTRVFRVLRGRIAKRVGLKTHLDLFWWRHRSEVTEHNYLVQWAMEKVRMSYGALGQDEVRHSGLGGRPRARQLARP